jgi:hypothetical protein
LQLSLAGLLFSIGVYNSSVAKSFFIETVNDVYYYGLLWMVLSRYTFDTSRLVMMDICLAAFVLSSLLVTEYRRP